MSASGKRSSVAPPMVMSPGASPVRLLAAPCVQPLSARQFTPDDQIAIMIGEPRRLALDRPQQPDRAQTGRAADAGAISTFTSRISGP